MLKFPYTFTDITYIMRMNDHGDKFHLSNKQFLNTTKQTSRTSKTPKTNQNQLFLFSVLTKISMQHVNFPYAFADITYIMRMNDYGDQNHGAKKIILDTTKQISKTFTSPKTKQNQLNFLHQKKSCGFFSQFQLKNTQTLQKKLTSAICLMPGLAVILTLKFVRSTRYFSVDVKKFYKRLLSRYKHLS